MYSWSPGKSRSRRSPPEPGPDQQQHLGVHHPVARHGDKVTVSAMTTDTAVLLSDTTDRVRTLTFNRPESATPCRPPCARSSSPRCATPRPTRGRRGDRHRSRPGVLRGPGPQGARQHHRASRHLPKWPPMTKPVIGAINGAAVTGGLELALYCDILIASSNSVRRHPRRVGCPPGAECGCRRRSVSGWRGG